MPTLLSFPLAHLTLRLDPSWWEEEHEKGELMSGTVLTMERKGNKGCGGEVY